MNDTNYKSFKSLRVSFFTAIKVPWNLNFMGANDEGVSSVMEANLKQKKIINEQKELTKNGMS